MTNRRQLLQTGLMALASVPVGSFASAVAGLRDSRSERPLAVCDLRYPEGVRFAEQSRRLGAVAYGVSADATDLWVKQLWPAWRRNPDKGWLAGVTGYDLLFCLEMMAHDFRHRVVYRAHHHTDASGLVVHAEILPLARVSLPPADWVQIQTERLMRHSSLAPRLSDAARCRATGSAAYLSGTDLVSWVIAPTASIDRSA